MPEESVMGARATRLKDTVFDGKFHSFKHIRYKREIDERSVGGENR